MGKSANLSPNKGTYSGFWGTFLLRMGKRIRDSFGPHTWLVVSPFKSQDQWWPQGEDHIARLDTSWHSSVCLGGNNTIGGEFEIAVILVDNKYDRFLREYINIAVQAKNYPPIELPSSAIIVAHLNVTTS